VALSRRNGRPRATLVFLILTSVTAITLDSRGGDSGLVGSIRDGAADALAPVRSAADGVLGPIGDAFSGITGYGDLKDENHRLREQVADLEGRALLSEDAEGELRDVLALVQLDYIGDLPTVAARVISSPISNFEQTIELDHGADEGVEVGMPVITGSGLVGRVVQASRSRSVVRLVTDPASSVGVRLSGSGEAGVAAGEGPDRPLSLSFVRTDAKIEPDELVVTSGLEGGSDVYPSGIPVGRVAEAAAPPGDLQQHVTVTPSADFAHLHYVKVVLTKPAPKG
jgi:rod shape-determining protein MreC